MKPEQVLDDAKKIAASSLAHDLDAFWCPIGRLKPAAMPYAVLGDPQTLNLYTYVRNIPTVNIDTDGHETLNANTNDRGNTRMVACNTDQCRATDAKISGSILAGFGVALGGGALSGTGAVNLVRNLFGLGVAAASTPAGQNIINGIGEAVTNPLPTVGLGSAASAEAFGFKPGFQVAGNIVGGELKNGSTALVNFAKVGNSFSVGVEMTGSAKGITGALNAIEKGAINAAKANGASDVTILAKDVANSRLANILEKKGFTQIVQDGQKTNNWSKTYRVQQ